MRYILLLILMLVCPGYLSAADLKGKEENSPIELEADQLEYDRDEDIYRASGDVYLKRGDLQVYGQKLQWNRKSGDVKAENDVRLISPDEEISGTRADYNIDQGVGTIEQGEIYLREGNLHVRGSRIERRGKNEFHIEEGTFTTCDGENPSWKFGSRSLDVTLGGYARARHMLFYLKDIPTLYLPYMIYPAKTERESGLLIPSVGYSEKRGFQFSGAYYQVLGINQDATLYLDSLSEMGVGKGLEYRYVFGRDNAGEARVYHIDVDQVDGEAIDEERYAIKWQHDGTLPGDIRMVADVEYVNDDEYFSDFGDVAEQYNKDKVQSIFSLTRDWGNNSLSGLVKYTKDLEVDDDTTLQLLPRITFDTVTTRIADTVFSYSLLGEYTHFWRREGQTGQRLRLRPLLKTDFQLWDVFSVTPQASWHERIYWELSDTGGTVDNGLPEFSLTLNTRIQRIFSGGLLGNGKLKHSLSPEVVYRFIPEEDQNGLPSFDSYDVIDEKNELEYALIQRFTLRTQEEGAQPQYRELVYLRMSLTQDLTSEASGRRFEDMGIEMVLLPLDGLRFDADSTFNVDRGWWEEATLELTIGQKDSRSLGLSFQYDKDEETKYGDLNLSLDFLKPLYLHYENRYDFISDSQLEQVVNLEYRQQCWSVFLIYRDKEDDQSVMLSFSMRGIGVVGGISGGLGGF